MNGFCLGSSLIKRKTKGKIYKYRVKFSASINHSNRIAANAELHQLRYVDQDIYRVVCIINFSIRRIFNTVKMYGSLLHNTISKFLGPTLWHKPDRKYTCKTESFAWSFHFPNNSNSNSLTDCFAEVHPSEGLQDKRLKALWVLPPTPPGSGTGPGQNHFHTLHATASKEMLHARYHGSAQVSAAQTWYQTWPARLSLGVHRTYEHTHTTESLCQVCHRCQAAGIYNLALFHKSPPIGKKSQ